MRWGCRTTTATSASRGLDAAFRAAAIGGRKPTFHELRHAHASALIADGWDLVSVSRRLGHASPNVTASFYSHEFEQAHRRDERRARLDGLYGTGTPGLRAV